MANIQQEEKIKMARSITQLYQRVQPYRVVQDSAENEKPSGGILQGFYRSGRTVEQF